MNGYTGSGYRGGSIQCISPDNLLLSQPLRSPRHDHHPTLSQGSGHLQSNTDDNNFQDMATTDSVTPWGDAFSAQNMPTQDETSAYYAGPSSTSHSPDQLSSPDWTTSPSSNNNAIVNSTAGGAGSASALKAGTGMCWDQNRCPIPPDARSSARCMPSQYTASSLDTSTATTAPPRRRSSDDQRSSTTTTRPTSSLKRNNTDISIDSDTSPTDASTAQQQPRRPLDPAKIRRNLGRVPHNLIERRYRDNLNSQIEALRLTVPSLRDAYDCTPPDVEESGATVAPAKLPSKAVIIATAVDYVKDLEQEREKLVLATRQLQEQVAGLQKLVRCDDCAILGYLGSLQLDAPPVAPV